MTEHGMIDLELIPDEAWRRLEHAAGDPAHPMRLVTLATTDDADKPEARLMILRGADRDSARLWMHTNPHSPKLLHLRARPDICLITYDPADQVQIRVYGQASVHTQGRVQRQHIEQTSSWLADFARAPTDPGEKPRLFDPRSEAFLAQGHAEREPSIRASTAIIVIHVHTIDWQQIIGCRERCARLRIEDQWAPASVEQILVDPPGDAAD